MARRSPGEGSIYRRGDGYWAATLTLGSGKRVVRYGKTRPEAARKLAELLAQEHQGQLSTPTKLTLQQWFDQWIGTLQVRPSTNRLYRLSLAPVLEEVGEVRLDRLTPLLLTSAWTKLARQDRGGRQLQLAHTYLKSCLGQAVDFDIIARNPMEKVKRPKWEATPRTYWTVEQASRFIETCQQSSSRWSRLFIFLTTCGLRISEALGLTWEDVDMEAGTVRVERALVWSGGRYTINSVKSKAGLRTVSLPTIAIEALMQQRAPGVPRSDGGVFGSCHGNIPRPDQLQRPLATLCKLAGVPRLHVHGLRHVAAALAFRATGDPYAVQHRLGHSHISVTMGIYAYGTRPDTQVADALERLLAGRG